MIDCLFVFVFPIISVGCTPLIIMVERDNMRNILKIKLTLMYTLIYNLSNGILLVYFLASFNLEIKELYYWRRFQKIKVFICDYF